jgi:cytochrome c biogenesis factor
VLGVVATSAWQSERVVAMKPGDSTDIAGYELAFRGVAPAQGPNYREQVGVLAVTRAGAAVTELAPSKRLYDAPRQATTEAGIHAAWHGDLYVVLGESRRTAAGSCGSISIAGADRPAPSSWRWAVPLSLSDRRSASAPPPAAPLTPRVM